MDKDTQPLLQPSPYGQPPGYPPPQAGYQPQPQAPPPPYVGGYQTVPKQQNTVVVTQQPTAVIYTRQYGSGDHYLLLSIIMSILCFVCGSWWALLCTIPAIFYAINAQQAEARGNIISMEKNRCTALFLNIIGVVVGVIIWIIIVINIIIRFSVTSESEYD